MKKKYLFIKLLNLLPHQISIYISKLILLSFKRKFFLELEKLSREFPAKTFSSKPHFNRILIIRLDGLGDMVWTTSLIRELKKNRPDSDIDLVVRSSVYSLMKQCPYINNIYKYDCDVAGNVKNANYKEFELKAKIFSSKFLVKNNYDIVILPREIYIDSGFDNIALSFYCKAKYRIARGCSYNTLQYARCMCTKKYFSGFITVEKPKHQVDQILDFISFLGGNIYDRKMELWEDDLSKNSVLKLLEEYNVGKDCILVVVGLAGSCPSRSWPIHNYLKLIDEVNKKYKNFVKFILIGESSLGIDVMNIKNDNIINLVGKTSLLELLSVVKCSNLYIGADTGTKHIASACGKYIIEISDHLKDDMYISRGSPDICGPWQVQNKVIEPEHGLDDCVGSCSKTYPHCIKQIKVDEVLSALETFIIKK